MNQLYLLRYTKQTGLWVRVLLAAAVFICSIRAQAASNAPSVFAATPTAVKAQPSLVGAITVQWNAVSGATQYVVERSIVAGVGFEQVGTVAAVSGKTIYTYRDAGLGNSEQYFYRIKAVDNAGDSPWSTVVSATTHAQNKTFNIMPLGDSNTQGTKYNDERPQTQRIAYRKQLYDLLMGINARFTFVGSERSGSAFLANDQHAGFSGSRTGDILSLMRTSSYRNQSNELITTGGTGLYLDRFNPDVVLLHLGTNGGQYGVSDDDQTIAEMAGILDEIDAYETRANKEVTVVLGLIINRIRQDNDPAAVEFTTRYNQKLATMAENRIRTRSDRLIVVDMERDAGLIYNYAYLGGDMDDPLHPSPSGYQKMANQWFKFLNPLLKPAPATSNPETTITQKPSEISKEKSPTFAFTSNKSPVYFEVSLNGGAYATVSSPYTLNNLADGTYTLSVRAVDAGGRKDATPATHTWTIITQPPTPPTFTSVTEDRGPVSNDGITSDNTIRLSGKAQSGVEVTVSENGRGVLGTTKADASSNWVFNYEGTTLPEGTYRFTAIATDIAGNESKVSNTFTVTIDRTAPTATLSTQAQAPVNAAFEVQIKFSEDVYGLAADDFTVSGAALSNLKEINKTTYSFTLTPPANGQGTASVSLAGSKVTDLAGNGNTAASKLDVAYDLKKPKLSLSSTAPQIVKAPFTVTFTFDEAVTGFAASDISVENGKASALQAVSTTVYTATISPTADGEVVVSVGADKAQDEAGNGNEASGELKRLYDVAPPTVALATTAPELTNKPLSVTVTFSEPITGLTLADFTVSNGKVSNLQQGTNNSYTVLLSPTADGETSLQLGANKVEDQAGNGNTASNTISRQYDATAPTVVLSTAAPALTNEPFIVVFRFSEAVESFEVAGISVSNGTAGNFQKTSAQEYSARISPAKDGEVSVQVPAGKAQDAAGNPNTASAVLGLTYDGTAPAGYAVAFGTDKVDHNSQRTVSFSVKGAEQGATYFYTITSSSGDKEVTGSAQTAAGSFTVGPLDLSTLNDGTLTLSFYQVDAAGNRGQTTTAQVEKMTKNVVEVAALEAIKVPFRTAFEALPLPERARVRYSNGEEEELAISWQQGNYNAQTPATYTLQGTLVLQPNTSNQDNRMATIQVTVEPNRPPIALNISVETFKPNAEPFEVIATLSTEDPDDESHTYTLVSGEGDTHNSYFTLTDDKLYLKSNSGLAGIRDFRIRVRTTDPYNNTLERAFTLRKEVYQPAQPIKFVNAFSPDNDGVNDTWTVPELKFYDEVSIQVFDRGGRRLFHTTNPENGWDGRGLDGQVREGSYFYMIEVKDTGLVQKGVLTILK